MLSASEPARRSWGSSRARSARPGPARRSSSLSGTSRASPRRASMMGAKGTVPPATSTHPPARTRYEGPRACVASATKRVLPTPASPATKTTVGWPSAAVPMAARTYSGRPPPPPDEQRTRDAGGHGAIIEGGRHIGADQRSTPVRWPWAGWPGAMDEAHAGRAELHPRPA